MHVVIGGHYLSNQVFKQPWPGMMRTVYGNHERFETTYFKKFPGYYTTGDGECVFLIARCFASCYLYSVTCTALPVQCYLCSVLVTLHHITCAVMILTAESVV